MAERRAYGEGVYRRAFLLVAQEGRVVADMEDDFHRFRVVVEHDRERVTRVGAETRRVPWTECAGAAAKLRSLEGMPLSRRHSAAGRYADPRVNCTHLFDVATLAIAHAAAGRTRRRYDVEIPDRRDGRTQARLARDGAPLLAWEVEGAKVLAPDPYTGLDLGGIAFLLWTEKRLDPELAEAALLLRRACFISMGRLRDLDAAADASAYVGLAPGSCHTFTPGVAERALRVRGATLEFSEHPEQLLADVAADERRAP
jgi:hypothetical protein